MQMVSHRHSASLPGSNGRRGSATVSHIAVKLRSQSPPMAIAGLLACLAIHIWCRLTVSDRVMNCVDLV
ncbi:hypothetical protein SAMN03159335_04092 [Burkholderia cepacia]|nr:hypothetical protein SAMN03159335_04092 [Burkholderia cepacia]